MLGPAQPDALRAEPAGAHGVRGGVCVRLDAEAPDAVRVREEPVDGGDDRLAVGHLAGLDVPGHRRRRRRGSSRGRRARSCRPSTGRRPHCRTTSPDRTRPCRRVDGQLLRAAHAGLAHPPGDDGGVRGLPTWLVSTPPRRSCRAGRPGSSPGAPAGRAPSRSQPSGCPVTIAPTAAPGRGRDAGDEDAVLLRWRERREHQLRQLGAAHAREGLVESDQALVDQLAGDDERRSRPYACRPWSAASTAGHARS